MHANLTTQHEIMLYYYHYLDGLFLNECWSKDRIGAVRRAFPPLHHHPTSQLQASQSPTTPFYNSACFVLHIYMCFDCCVSVCLFCVPISYNTKKSQKLHDITPHTWHRGGGGDESRGRTIYLINHSIWPYYVLYMWFFQSIPHEIYSWILWWRSSYPIKRYIKQYANTASILSLMKSTRI